MAKRKVNKGRKPKMNVGISSKFITGSGKYNVHWYTDADWDRSKSKRKHPMGRRIFTKRKDATKFKNNKIKNLKNKGYKIDYIYLAD